MKPVKLSVIVPAYNEERTIKQVLHVLLTQKEVKQVVIVDDCSTDGTSALVNNVKDKRIILIRHKKNMGKGAAIRTGLDHVTGTHVLIQDADMEYDPREIPTLLDPIKAGRADVVFGSRFYGAHTNMFYWHLVGNKLLNFVVNILYDTTLSDMETCYKVVPTALMRELNLTERDFRIEPEITCKLLKRGAKILEVPITYVGRTYAEGKKITWKDGIKAVRTIVRLRAFSH